MESSPEDREKLGKKLTPCSTPCGINGILTRLTRSSRLSGAVLNPLRHQSNHHGQMKSRMCVLKGRCSTPCGINGILTASCMRCSFKGLRVLNALRHQWNPHSMDSNLLAYKDLWVVLRDTQLF